MFYTDKDGGLHIHPLEDSVFARFAAEGGKVNGRIVSVTQTGDVASVVLGFDDVSEPALSSWVDFHTLLRINGVWKITNKTATHATRAAWAADRNVQAEEATLA